MLKAGNVCSNCRAMFGYWWIGLAGVSCFMVGLGGVGCLGGGLSTCFVHKPLL